MNENALHSRSKIKKCFKSKGEEEEKCNTKTTLELHIQYTESEWNKVNICAEWERERERDDDDDGLLNDDLLVCSSLLLALVLLSFIHFYFYFIFYQLYSDGANVVMCALCMYRML